MTGSVVLGWGTGRERNRDTVRREQPWRAEWLELYFNCSNIPAQSHDSSLPSPRWLLKEPLLETSKENDV